jgi:hypothetical protein
MRVRFEIELFHPEDSDKPVTIVKEIFETRPSYGEGFWSEAFWRHASERIGKLCYKQMMEIWEAGTRIFRGELTH